MLTAEEAHKHTLAIDRGWFQNQIRTLEDRIWLAINKGELRISLHIVLSKTANLDFLVQHLQELGYKVTTDRKGQENTAYLDIQW